MVILNFDIIFSDLTQKFEYRNRFDVLLENFIRIIVQYRNSSVQQAVAFKLFQMSYFEIPIRAFQIISDQKNHNFGADSRFWIVDSIFWKFKSKFKLVSRFWNVWLIFMLLNFIADSRFWFIDQITILLSHLNRKNIQFLPLNKIGIRFSTPNGR